jgi:hypothetical protein
MSGDLLMFFAREQFMRTLKSISQLCARNGLGFLDLASQRYLFSRLHRLHRLSKDNS